MLKSSLSLTHTPGMVHEHHLRARGHSSHKPSLLESHGLKGVGVMPLVVMPSHHSSTFFLAKQTKHMMFKTSTSHIHQPVWQDCDWSYAGFITRYPTCWTSQLSMPEWVTHLSLWSHCAMSAAFPDSSFTFTLNRKDYSWVSVSLKLGFCSKDLEKKNTHTHNKFK